MLIKITNHQISLPILSRDMFWINMLCRSPRLMTAYEGKQILAPTIRSYGISKPAVIMCGGRCLPPRNDTLLVSRRAAQAGLQVRSQLVMLPR